MAADDNLTRSQWLAAFSERLGLPAPDEATVETLLDLAGSAAHASERTAAPIACFLVGLSEMSPDQALAIARQIEAGA